MKSNEFRCLSSRYIDVRIVSSVVKDHIRFDILLVYSPNKVENIIYEIGDETLGNQFSKEEIRTIKVILSMHNIWNIPL